MRSPSRPAPESFEGNDQLITGIITAGWVIALIILLILRGDLAASDRWWIWTCVAGTCIGLFGLFYVPKLKRSRARAAQRRAAAGPGDS